MRVALLCAVLLAAHAHFADDLVLGEDPRKPIEVDDVLLCHSCHAAVIETVRHVRLPRARAACARRGRV